MPYSPPKLLAMADSAAQSLIVRLPAKTARSIVRIVDLPGSAYRSVDEFIRIAVENQLALDGAPDGRLAPSDGSAEREVAAAASPRSAAAPPAAAAAPKAPASATPKMGLESSADLLRRPDVIDPENLHGTIPTAGLPLSSFTNRLTPLLAGPRVLANLYAGRGAPTIDSYLDLTAKAARVIGFRLRTEDDAAGRRGRARRSTAWPTGEDESKSLIRYRSCFMFQPEKGGFSGPLLALGLVAVVDGTPFLTEVGAAFACSTSPAIDDPDGVDLLGSDQRKILSKAIIHIPGELIEINQFLAAVERASGSQDAVDKELGFSHHSWSEAQVVSHRAAMVGRLRDLAVIDVETGPKTIIVHGTGHAEFMEHLSAATETDPA